MVISCVGLVICRLSNDGRQMTTKMTFSIRELILNSGEAVNFYAGNLAAVVYRLCDEIDFRSKSPTSLAT